MTPRSVKRADVLRRRRHGRWYRKMRRPEIARWLEADRTIRETIQRQMDSFDALERAGAPVYGTGDDLVRWLIYGA